MKTIHQLSASVVAKIAAGEIIERPAYVVKELLDNALDAQATEIRIELTDYGAEKIIVTDNGIGMSKEDIEECYKLHTTSKVPADADLLQIDSLGFRGEALASIAAVANVIIESKPNAHLAGTRLVLQHKRPTLHSLGMPDGTRVIVSGLFDNVPARKQALLDKKKEFKKIMDIIYTYILGYPDRVFSVSHNGKILITTQSSTIEQRILQLLGEPIFSHLLPLSITSPYYQVSGYISTPQLPAHHSFQYLFINGRPVIDVALQRVVKEAYATLLPHSIQPAYLFFLSCPSEYLDVNIHPRKEVVRLTHQADLYVSLRSSVEETLRSGDIQFELPQLFIHDQDDQLTYTTLADQLKKDVLPKKITQLAGRTEQHSVIQIHNLYILAETENGFLLVDQHAAHERILYDEYYRYYQQKKAQSEKIKLTTPIEIDLPEVAVHTFEAYRADLEQLGFQIQQTSQLIFLVTEIPSLFAQRNIPKLIAEFLQELDTHAFTARIDTGSKKMLAYLACRSAVKAGDPLNTDQMKNILTALEATPNAVTCPHGRPLKYTVDLQQLHSIFRRR